MYYYLPSHLPPSIPPSIPPFFITIASSSPHTPWRHTTFNESAPMTGQRLGKVYELYKRSRRTNMIIKWLYRAAKLSLTKRKMIRRVLLVYQISHAPRKKKKKKKKLYFYQPHQSKDSLE